MSTLSIPSIESDLAAMSREQRIAELRDCMANIFANLERASKIVAAMEADGQLVDSDGCEDLELVLPYLRKIAARQISVNVLRAYPPLAPAYAGIAEAIACLPPDEQDRFLESEHVIAIPGEVGEYKPRVSGRNLTRNDITILIDRKACKVRSEAEQVRWQLERAKVRTQPPAEKLPYTISGNRFVIDRGPLGALTLTKKDLQRIIRSMD